MRDNDWAFFQNRGCDYFPCHQGVPEEDFNCLFCYCPLYSLGRDCGGGFEITASGKKSCLNCGFPHYADNYSAVLRKLGEVITRTAGACRLQEEKNGEG